MEMSDVFFTMPTTPNANINIANIKGTVSRYF